VSRNRAAARAWRFVGGFAVAVAAAALGSYALFGWEAGSEESSDSPAASSRLDAAVGAAPSTAVGGVSPVMPLQAAGTNHSADDGPTAGEATQIGAFAHPDAPAERVQAAPIHIGEYINADDDSPKPSAAGAGHQIGPPLDPGA
jgi:hypothetical protein